ncbi:M67 family metallopeptidase [Inmirania thermothiophila]|nr:M67 family metallopeptidase [Inmirania thermothiophila]
MSVLRLPGHLRARIAAWAARAHPEEACGLLVGRQAGGCTEVVRVVRAANLDRARARDRYELDPEDFLRTDAEARAEGLAVVGVWHSHPDHPARPSETDRARAWPGWSYVIVAVTAAGAGELRSWRLGAGRAFEEEEVRP